MREARHVAALDAAQAAAADDGRKGMIPFGRPFLDHVLHALADAGFCEVALVIAPDHADVRRYYGSLPLTRLEVSCVTQAEPRGTADALLAAEAWTEGGPFITLNSDNLYPVDVLAALACAEGPAVPGFRVTSLGLSIERAGAFALMECDARGCLSRISEKPGAAAIEAAGADAMISMNIWRFDSRIFDACRDVPVSSRGEKELPQAAGLAASRGTCFDVLPALGPVLDLSRREDVAAVARALEGARVAL